MQFSNRQVLQKKPFGYFAVVDMRVSLYFDIYHSSSLKILSLIDLYLQKNEQDVILELCKLVLRKIIKLLTFLFIDFFRLLICCLKTLKELFG